MQSMEWKQVREEVLSDSKVRAAYDEKSPYYQFVCQLIKRRKSLDITQADLAVRLGTSQSAIARLESGSGNVTIGTLSRVAKELGCVVRLVLEDNEEEGNHPAGVLCTR